jgi:hypothetical protein
MRNKKNFISKYWPLLMAVVVLWGVLAVFLFEIIQRNDGHLIYTIDDAYIHLTMAKNFAQHGIWGVTKHEFSSSSSSILWTLLISATHLIFGVNEISPLILNIIFATAILIFIYRILNKHESPFTSIFIFLVLLGIIFLVPLPVIIFSGMEHTLHAFINIVFAYLSVKSLAEKSSPSSSSDLKLLLWAALLPFVRYEGLFLILEMCILFYLRKRGKYAFLLGIAAVIPIGIYGIISVIHGWSWLPNTILLKGNTPNFTSIEGFFNLLGYSCYSLMVKNIHMLFLTLTALLSYIFRFNKNEDVWEEGQILLATLLLTTLLHLQYARLGWFFRYEAYLIVFGLFTFAFALCDYLPSWTLKVNRRFIPKYLAISLAVFLPFLFIAERGFDVLKKIPGATNNVYEQQYQMGLFLKEFYQGASIAAVDVGAINFLADIKCLDLMGIGTNDVPNKFYTRDYLVQRGNLIRSKGVKLALLYDWYFDSIHPPEWINVGEWGIDNNVSCSGDKVTFFSIGKSEEKNLIANLKTFSSRLPQGVKQRGKYTEVE